MGFQVLNAGGYIDYGTEPKLKRTKGVKSMSNVKPLLPTGLNTHEPDDDFFKREYLPDNSPVDPLLPAEVQRLEDRRPKAHGRRYGSVEPLLPPGIG